MYARKEINEAVQLRNVEKLRSFLETRNPDKASKMAARKVIKDFEVAKLTIDTGDTLAHLAARADLGALRRLSTRRNFELRNLKGANDISVRDLINERMDELQGYRLSILTKTVGPVVSLSGWSFNDTIKITVQSGQHIMHATSDPVSACIMVAGGIMIGLGMSTKIFAQDGLKKKLAEHLNNY